MSSRRSFLLSSGAGILSLATPRLMLGAVSTKDFPQAPPPVGGLPVPKEKMPAMHAASEQKKEKYPSLPPEKKVGFALVGLGRLTMEELLPAFGESRLAKCVALVSGDAAKASRLAQRFGVPESGLYSYENYDRLAENKSVQAVYIVLPNSMHKEFTVRGAAAGKHILCEKPMSVNAEDAQVMLDACKKAKVKLMIAYRQHYDSQVRRVRELVMKKTFGQPKIFEGFIGQNQDGSKDGVKQWRHVRALAGGGALPDIGLYCLNGVRYMTGEEPVEVQAMMHSTSSDPRFKEVEESFLWQMRFPSGLLASCQSSYSTHTSKFFRFSNETGFIRMDPAFQYEGNKLSLAWADGNIENRLEPEGPTPSQFTSEIDHMADCILNNKEPQSPGEEGLQDHRIMDALYESARTKKPVMLKEHTGLDVFRHPKSLV